MIEDTQRWDPVRTLGQRFTRAWAESSSPPQLSDFLPDGPAIRREVLLALVRIDMQARWARPGLGKTLEQYCAELPELRSDDLRGELVRAEIFARRRGGDTVDIEEYLHRYPEYADQIVALTGPETRTIATALAEPAAVATVATPTPVGDPLERIRAGQSFDDFDLLTSLGAGAFARVFLARQRSMQRLVAVKVSENRGSEPQTLAQLDHDYIVRVFDQRIVGSQRLRLLYMQYLPGGTLLGVLRRVRATPIEQRDGALLLAAVDKEMADKGEARPIESSVRAEIASLSWPDTIAWLGRRLADALSYADSRGVLHRDVKPANVLLTAEGVPKLADFNISFSGATPGSSPVAYFGGSLSYMSPEQLAAAHPDLPGTAADLDGRSDIYSLGVVLWELLTGRKPFEDTATDGGDATALSAMIDLREAGPDRHAIARLPHDCPAVLRRVLLTCMAPRPEDRWADAATLVQQFDLCLDPHARNLVDPPAGSLQLRSRRWTAPIFALSIGVPNVLASAYNIAQNQTLVISKLSPDAQNRFESVAATNNVVAFGLGIALIVYFCRRLIVVPHRLRHGRPVTQRTLAETRRDTLLIGDRTVAICFGLWMVAGLLWPFVLRLRTDELTAGLYLHLLLAQIVCGAIAVAYPFFFTAFYAVRCVYPAFLPYGATSPADAVLLRGLHRRSNLYLAVAASVPLLGVAGLTFLQADEVSAVIGAVRVLCVGSIVAFVATYLLSRTMAADLAALERVVVR